MYGMVNRALQEMVVAAHGAETWTRVVQRAGIQDITLFLSHESYPDAITYDLVAATCAETSRTPADVLEAFGRHWVLETASRGYGSLMDAGGASLEEFLLNLPNFHTRVSLIFRHLAPPEFRATVEGPGCVRVAYISHREGLRDFVVGLLKGLGQRFSTPVHVEHVVARGLAGHDEFLVRWSTGGGE